MTKCLGATLAVVFLLTGGCGCSNRPTWKYDGALHKAIAGADRVVLLDAGFDCYNRNPKANTLAELSEPDEIRQFAERLEFDKNQSLTGCPCNGYPRVDWYQGKTRLATVSIQHAQAIRWKGFGADGKLTSKSSKSLLQWLLDHGADPAKMK